jgi:hypothetical protein
MHLCIIKQMWRDFIAQWNDAMRVNGRSGVRGNEVRI